MEKRKYDYILKIQLLGVTSVGKKSLMIRYIDNIFVDNYLATIGLEYKIKIFYYENLLIKALIFDQIFSERVYYTNAPNNYYKRTDGIIITYDISNKGSFDVIKNLKEK